MKRRFPADSQHILKRQRPQSSDINSNVEAHSTLAASSGSSSSSHTMSSLKDIMDVDVEPLESQAMRSRQAAQQQSDLDQSGSSTKEAPKHDAREQPHVTRRKSNRVSKSSSQGSSSRPSLSRRRSSSTAESMDSDGLSLGSASATGISRQTFRGSNPPESVRYTPVTGRVSRAKKGQPVHVCEQCDPSRVFTRAEHLRRHQLGHQKHAYPCTFEDCEKAFHRPDLLARHMNRHETQGEKAYKAGDARSRQSSTSSDSQSPRFKVQTPSTVENSSPARVSETINPAPPRTSVSTGSGMTALHPMVPSFGDVNLSGPSTAGQYDRVGLGPVGAGPTTSAALSSAAHGTTTYSTSSMPSLSQEPPFRSINDSILGAMFLSQDLTGQLFPTSSAANSLPLQTVKDLEPPGLSFGSPWYSSDSTWTTPSDRHGSTWVRDRSLSVATNRDNWNNQPIAWSPQYPNKSDQTLRTASLEAVPEHYESPPYLSPHISPNASYPLAGVSSPAGGYHELPPLLDFPKSELAGFDKRRNVLVDKPHLASPSGEAVTVTLEDRIEEYLIAYQFYLEPVYSVIHPETFQTHPSDLVRKAMAALGSQFHILPGDRENGSQLHDSCLRMILPHSYWDFQTMQAIFLTEVFGRFRSQKIDARLSVAFRRLYKMLVESSDADMKHRFARLNFYEISSSIRIEVENQNKNGTPTTYLKVLDGVWREWIEWEVRQRLRAACFMFDTHQKFCYEQRRCQPRATAENTFIKVPCPKSLWIAPTSRQWFEVIQTLDCTAVRLIHPENMSAAEISRLPLSAQADAIGIVFELLPSRDQAPLPTLGHGTNARLIKKLTSVFPQFIHTHGYLALYHTPLQPLLSLTGNTWLFGQKLTSHSDIDAIPQAVRIWASSPAAAQATWHACHLLRHTFKNVSDRDRPFRGVSEYWFLYTSTLIIWAFGYRPSTLSALVSSSTTISRPASSVTLAAEDSADIKSAALAWTEAMIDLKPEHLINSQLRTETGPVIDAARLRLQQEAVMSHGRSGMLLDACGVLDRITNVANESQGPLQGEKMTSLDLSPASSETGTAANSSVDEETPAEGSDIETDWDEGEGRRDKVYREICGLNWGQVFSNAKLKEDRAKRLLDEPQKQKLIDFLMREFYAIFEKVSTTHRTCAGGYGSQSQDTAPISASLNDNLPPHITSMKRNLDDGEDIPGEEEGDRPPKRPKHLPNPCEDKPPGMKFACPYHQHNPRKYGVNTQSSAADYRSCAGPGWKSVARIKEHLYRRHRVPIKCNRCGEPFKDQNHLNFHQRKQIPCEVWPEAPNEGVTADIEKRLKSRKKSWPNQSEEERWREVYQVLFPNEEIPSPYYDHDDELAEFDAYSRRETPRVFYRLLESRASTNQLTQEIKGEMVDMVQECRRFVYRQYRQEAQGALAPDGSNPAVPPSSEPPLLTSNGTRSDNDNTSQQTQGQADIPDFFDYDPDFFQSLFQDDNPPGYERFAVNNTDPSQIGCFCLDSCSCTPRFQGSSRDEVILSS